MAHEPASGRAVSIARASDVNAGLLFDEISLRCRCGMLRGLDLVMITMPSFPRCRIPQCSLLLLLALLQGCASVYKPRNQAIGAIQNDRGYRFSADYARDRGDHAVFLSFSGGGTRAAALSYGVLQELRDTRVESFGRPVRLLDEVDLISSVSGGSFTAAYYALFGDLTFENYEDVFLRQSIQGTLIRKLFNPLYWWRSLFTAFDRTEMAVEYYDRHIFRGKTFADIPIGERPYVEINATDLGGGQRFAFTQGNFDLICSDLDSFSVARAVTASSAVPVAFPPVVIQNHAGACDTSRSNRIRNIKAKRHPTGRQTDLSKRLNAYADRAARQYLHLVDGGIVDNLGLRALIDRMDAAGPDLFTQNQVRVPKDVLIIMVNAEVRPERSIELSAGKPSVLDTVDAFSHVQIALYNQETKLLIGEKVREMESELRRRGHDVRFYLAEVSFESLEEQNLKSFFNNLPTSLELSESEVNVLIGAGRRLLRQAPEYRAFVQANKTRGD